MNQLQMKIIKPKIVDVLEARGYKFIQQQTQDSWYTDGYRSRGTAAI